MAGGSAATSANAGDGIRGRERSGNHGRQAGCGWPTDTLASVADGLRSVLPPRGGHKLDQSRIHEAAPR